MHKNALRALVIGAAATLSLGIAAPPTQAATGYNRCPNGYFCIFSDPNGQGRIAYFQSGSPNLAQQGIDNAASSVWNRSAAAFALCDGYNKVGNLWDIFPGAQGNLPPDVDNRASSIAMYAHGCS